MILYNIPFSREKNIAEAYNVFMELLPSDDDYGAFIDRDAMFVHPFYGRQIEDIIEATGEDLYTCMTNRVNCRKQLHEHPHAFKIDDMRYHVKEGEKLYNEKYGVVEDITDIVPGISGVVMILKKSAWKRIGGFKGSGMLGVDNQLHYDVRDSGGRVMLMQGVYTYHWYRGGDCKYINHLK